MPSRNALNATHDSIASLHALRSDFSFAHFLSPHAKQTRRRCKRGLKNTAYTRQLLLPSSVLGCNYTHTLTHTRTHAQGDLLCQGCTRGCTRAHTAVWIYSFVSHTTFFDDQLCTFSHSLSRLLFLFIFVIHFAPPFAVPALLLLLLLRLLRFFAKIVQQIGGKLRRIWLVSVSGCWDCR